MGCLQLPVQRRHRTGLDGGEHKFTPLIRWLTTKTTESFLQRQVSCICGMYIFAMRIRLPELDHAIGYGLAIGIQQFSVNRDSLTLNGGRSEIAGIEPVKTNMEIGSDRL